MNRLMFTLFIAFVLPVLNVHAQQKSNETDIAAIRAAFKKINSAALNLEEFKYEADGCVEDGTVQYYFKGKEIVKVVETGSIGDGSWRNEYYYEGGKFFFAYQTIVGGPAIGPETKTEYRIYVKDGKAIRYMEDQKIIPADTRVSEALPMAGKLLKAYKTKAFIETLCNN
jgi:hypothetical protein